MEPGTFVGKDGRTYRWVSNVAGSLRVEVRAERPLMGDSTPHWIPTELNGADWPAAKAALDELVGQEQWVEIRGRTSVFRIKPDGSALQWRFYRIDEPEVKHGGQFSSTGDDGWHTYEGRPIDEHEVVAAYRKGLAIGREDALKDAQELVKEIDRRLPRGAIPVSNVLHIHLTDVEHLRALAEKLRVEA